MSVGTPLNAIVYSSGLYNSQRDDKSRTSIRFYYNSNGNNINEYISSSSFGIG